MINASDNEVRKFFAETTFEGIFSKEIKSSKVEYFKGHIHSITINGVPNNVIGSFINVPLSATDIPEGPCTFKCRLKEEVRRSPSQINFSLAPKTLRATTPIQSMHKNEIHNYNSQEYMPPTFSTEENTLAEDWDLGVSKRLIGQVIKKAEENEYYFSDIRRIEDFTKVDVENSLSIKLEEQYLLQLELNKYYSFEWQLLSYDPEHPKFGVNPQSEFIRVTESEVVHLLNKQIMSYSPGAKQKAVKTIDILKNQLTASGEDIFIYELLQNANDYQHEVNGVKQLVDVEFHITDEHLFFLHSGSYFNERNVAALCDYNDKEKTSNSEAIGYKGIGFKTVFAYNDYVYLQSGNYSFRFDREATKRKKNIPWQILPIPTEIQEVSTDIRSIFTHADQDYRVRFALRPTEKKALRTSGSNYVALFQNTFDSERVILFIPHINTVKIFFHDNEIEDICRTRSSETWCVSEDKKYVGNIPPDLTEELNSRIKKQDGKIPEKYQDFKKTSIGFACKKSGRFLEPVEDSCLYCYLPAKKAQWGLGFLLNTDMIPIGTRENVEPKEKINHVISRIAGQQFFHWIQDLMKSGEYDYDSILGLIPDFDNLIDNTHDEDVKQFLQEFKDGYEEELLGDHGDIIPILNDNNELDFVKINEVNYDTLGLTCSNIISDEDLLRIVEWKDHFVHPDLRDYQNKVLKKNIARILNTYAGNGYSFDNSDVLDACENLDFQTWLSEKSNCNNFLAFLLEKNILSEYKEKSIFPDEVDGKLHAGNHIYDDIDEYIPYLRAFDEFLPRLAEDTQEILTKYHRWSEIKESIFKPFDADKFVDEELLSKKHLDRTKEILNNAEASFAFYHFLATYVGFSERYKNLPFVSYNNVDVIEDFNGFVFFDSTEAESLFQEDWIDQSWFSILSPKYSDSAKQYFKDNFGVRDYTLRTFVDDILYTDASREYLSEHASTHPAFVRYCYSHQDLFGKNSLKDFALLAKDKDGDIEFILSEDLLYFNENDISSAQSHQWIENGWFYSLSDNYFNLVEDDNETYKEFIASAFGVKQFNMDTFITDVVIPKANKICENIGGSATDTDTNESIEFLQFLGANSKLIAEKNGFSNFQAIHLYRYDVWTAVKDREIPVFLFDAELKSLLEADWTPEDFAYMLEERYNNEVFNRYPSLKKHLSISTYSFDEAKKALLHPQCISEFADDANEKEKNLSIHRFFYSHADELLAKDYKELAKIPLLVNGSDDEIAFVLDIVYMPDYFMPIGKGIESTVNKYIDAIFVSSEYAQTDDLDEKDVINTIKQWNNYFSSLGVLTKIKDLVINSVLPNLGETDDENILTLLGEYYDEIHTEEDWDNHLQQLKKLRVCSGDEFIPISQAVFIECTSSEPFPVISIPNQVNSSYSHLKGNASKLLKEIIEVTSCKCIADLDNWRKDKLDKYLFLQINNPAKAIEVNVAIVSEIVSTYSDKAEFYKPYLKEIKLLNTDRNLCAPTELTEGTAYSPVCDFQHFDFQLNYISDDYILPETDIKSLKNFLRDMKVVYSFKNTHLPLISQSYSFAVYFWTEYITKSANFEHIKTFISDLDKYTIIPTQQPELVKKASELYAWYIIDKYVKGKINDFNAYTPLESIFNNSRVKEEILSKLSFGFSLSADHCLEALFTCNNKDDRKTILSWLSDKKSFVDRSKAKIIYNDENFKWQTGKGDRNRRALKDLLVLDYHDIPTRQLFDKSDNVLSWNHFNTTEIFDSFCFIFGISPISITKDFKQRFSPDPESYNYLTRSNNIKRDLKLPLLIIAASTYPENWLNKYKDFSGKLDEFDFINCDSISIEYGDKLSKTNIRYHRDTEKKHIYFVDDLIESKFVFQRFVEDMCLLLELEGDRNQIEEIFDNSSPAQLVDELIDEDIKRSDEFRSICKDLSLMVVVETPIKDEPEEPITIPIFGQPIIDVLDETPGEESVEVDETVIDDKPIEKNPDIEERTKDVGTGIKNTSPECDQPDTPNGNYNNQRAKVQGDSRHTFPNGSKPERPTYIGDDHKQDKFDKSPTPQRRRSLDNEDWKPKPQSNQGVEQYNPGLHPNRDVVEWKKDIPQAELGVADVTEEEAMAITNLIGGSKTLDEIIDEHLVARYRMYHALKEKGYIPTESEPDFIRNRKNDNQGVQTNKGYIHTRSAKGGILFLSGLLWRELVHNGGRICMYYGNKAYDFEIIDSVQKLINFVGRDNIIIQVSGENKEQIINSIFSGQVESTKAHILIRIKSNSRYNSMFETTYNVDDDNDFSIS